MKGSIEKSSYELTGASKSSCDDGFARAELLEETLDSIP